MIGLGSYSVKRWKHGWVSLQVGVLALAVILDLELGQVGFHFGPFGGGLYLWAQA